MKNIKNKKFVILTTILIIAVFAVIYWSFSDTYLTGQIFIDSIPKQPMNNILGVEGQPIAFVYTKDESYGNYIRLVNQFPISDEVGKKLEGQYKTFDFKLEFNGKAVGSEYILTLEKTSETTLDENWVKVYLTSSEVGLNSCFRANGRVKTYNEYNKLNNKEIIVYRAKVTESDVKAGYRDFRLRMWISEDIKIENSAMESKTFVARVSMHAQGSL